MKLSRCPVCHSSLHLDTLVQDQAGKELIATISRLSTTTSSSVLSYLALFRPAKSDLSNGRALKLLGQVLGLTENETALVQALDQTVMNITTNRREQGDTKPLSNHNYLKKVLAGIPGWDLNARQYHEISKPINSAGKGNVSDALLDIDNEDWARFSGNGEAD